MIAPKTIFQASALTSGLVTQQQLADGIRVVGEGASDEVLAARLVHEGVLTEYQAQQLQLGRTKLTLGPYLITDWIGQGGMGQVFKAVHNVMGRQCAVKVLPLEKATEQSRLAFLREIRLQAGLDCPYLVRAYDAGQDGSVHYLVTEYVPGTDLRRLVRRSGKLSMSHAASIVMQAALGLQYAHERGLIHRDVKPGNILVAPDGRTKVSDVGLAAWSTAMSEDPRAGRVVGTADFLSPEQIRSPLNVTPASDIYSLGCTLYYAVCGKAPFAGGDTASKCRRHCEEMPFHPRRFAPELSDDFVDTIADMMEKDPQKRVASAADVAVRLEPWVGEPQGSEDYPRSSISWTAPPPPAEAQRMAETEAAGTLSQLGSGALDASDSRPVVPPAIPQTSAVTRPSRSDTAVAVAMALALAIPASLLVGALVGFWIHGVLRG